MKKLTLLFDADDTLLDFNAAETASITNALGELGLLHYENIVPTYKEYNLQCWKEYEKNLITKEQLGQERFIRLFNHYSIKGIDAKTVGDVYWKYLSLADQVIDGVYDMLEKIYLKHDLYVITNGVTAIQTSRFKLAGLEPYFKKRYISELMKTRKPEKKFFDLIEQDLGHLDRDTTYIIGDSLSSDIQGGLNSGIKTIWYNRNNEEINKDIMPNYIVHNYEELIELINLLERDKC